MDLDLRKLRYFVAVAETLHFGRAAEQLHIAQPALSRQIQALERDLKVTLFARGPHGAALTSAGQQLFADALPLLASADATRRRAIRAARDMSTFTVGFMPGLMVSAAVRVFSVQHPELSMQVMRTSWDDQADVLRDGRADVGYLRLPVDGRGLRLEPLLAEPRVVLVPARHRLADKDSVRFAELASEHLLQNPDSVPEWREIADELRTPQPGDLPVFRTVEEKLEHVAAGRGIVVLPLSAAAFYTRQDVTFLMIDDIAPSQVCLAWDNTRRTQLIPEFVAIAHSQSDSAVSTGTGKARPAATTSA